MSKYHVGDMVSLKKGHPCGENYWKILRTGVDYKLKCMGCEHDVWLKRTDFQRRVRKILDKDGKMISVLHYQPEMEEEKESK